MSATFFDTAVQHAREGAADMHIYADAENNIIDWELTEKGNRLVDDSHVTDLMLAMGGRVVRLVSPVSVEQIDTTYHYRGEQ